MKILLIGNYVNDAQQSMQRFSSVMASGLAEAGHETRVCRPPVIAGSLHPSEHGVGKWLGYVDKLALFPAVLRHAAAWADVVHICDHSNALYLRHLRTRPHVVTCHDLFGIRRAFHQTRSNRTGKAGKGLQSMIVKGLATAQHIACVSDATRADLHRLTNIPEDRTSRIYNGLNFPYSRVPAKEAAARIRELGVNADRPFLLHVGGNSWYKNRLGVLRIFHSLLSRGGAGAPALVMAGKPWAPEMRGFVLENGLGGHALELVGLREADLQALYSAAQALLFPSLQEGFGWPIIEAQACGCLVITSNRAPMNEIGGSAAVYVDPENVDEAAEIVRSVLDKADRRREESLRNAERFGTADMIRSYIDLYKKVTQ